MEALRLAAASRAAAAPVKKSKDQPERLRPLAERLEDQRERTQADDDLLRQRRPRQYLRFSAYW